MMLTKEGELHDIGNNTCVIVLNSAILMEFGLFIVS